MEDAKNLSKAYDPKQVEERLYKIWVEKGYFMPEIDYEKEPYTIVIPPPNITGQLHMGHALDNTIQDILIRWRRMQGYSTLWLPGTDHASIATEAKIVETLAKEGKTKYELGREGFLERAWEWKREYGGRIINQLKKLGCSCDWTRERFTLDEGCSKAVTKVFVSLYEKGLIYRGERIINWCPNCKTSISDIETIYDDEKGHFWHIKYPVKGSDEFIEIATTRPETMLGDTAVAVHPEDERYKHLIGKTLILPLMNREIPIIADEYVDMEFGTGAVKITPAHDPNDFEVGLRHNLPMPRVMNDDGTINELGGKYCGLDRYEARKRIVEDLKEQGYLVNIKDHDHSVGHCQRCNTIIEPILSKQWFVKMKPLAEPAIEVVRDGRVKFVPERFSKIYFNWMENIQDWCISRQLWWGHRIPAYYCQDCGEIIVAEEAPEKCSKCSGELRQDEDTLDTWFSSALWPFSTLGWPEKTEDLKYFYPTSVLVTGYDIIFFWVARMIFSAMENMKKEPFKYVYIHGIVRDSEGRKMSKSLGNGIDPLEVIDKYGADALRFNLISGNSPGNDMRFYWERVEAFSNFANKIWNAARFVLMNTDENKDYNEIFNSNEDKLTNPDYWILSKLNKLIKEVTENMEKFELGIAAQKIYDFIWFEFCDWYIELVKPRLYSENEEDKAIAQATLINVLVNSMKLLHPFMPFITEEIYSHIPKASESIVISKWPEYDETMNFTSQEENMEIIMDAIKGIRNIRAEMNVAPSRKSKTIIVSEREEIRNAMLEGTSYIQKLAYSSEVIIKEEKKDIPKDAVSVIIEGAEIFLPLEDLIDKEKEIERLAKEKEKLEKELERVRNKLTNEKFIAKAPEKIIQEERDKEKKYTELMEKVLERLKALE
ncbi:valine--tRNA ligase [Lutispora thermophila]|uniref:Valine--tRNA ligase n=1 Tax=Lutispora thermophila DSM 19022 TaxID=1122184 RepID=A0A1M6GLJ7_9FIRM|nr:valine--tRNA ligase [Lutispora thermophila]SHJ10765.1 valyl-tRNA synthetase [Lutispora thermophila DSM 19022]